ncbi:MAG: aldose 1-epimerase family protein [Lachnospiraceae bacterium]|nr:aldose 1-epimerase family protein [Lachnospiraceae bacterium]
MKYTLENDLLKVTFDSFGAEIKSVIGKKNGREYIWNGDPSYWNRTAPVLFPFVGSLKDNKYIFEGKAYNMTSHGFARDLEHEMVEITDTSISFILRDSAKTYENYPFHFEFKNTYQLEGDTITVTWAVTNPGQDRDDKTLYFSVGAHPAFMCPIYGEADKSGYRLFFDGINELHHHGNLTGTCTHEDLTLTLTDNRAVITPEFFDRTTYIAEGNQTGKIGLETPDGKRIVTVTFDAPLFGIWSPEKKNAPFLCIEPWYGRADYDDYSGDLTSRDYCNKISENEVFEKSYRMKFE